MIKKGVDRNQISFFCLEELISEESEIRVIDAFIDYLDLDKLGFVQKGKIKNGSPAFSSATLLKLYFYGYLNRIRSSRKLESECKRNIELWWLLERQQPGYRTIANFRKENVSGLKKVFSQFNHFLKNEKLFGRKTVAVDGSKFRAQNSKKNNFNEKKIDRHISYLENKLEEYLNDIEEADKREDSLAKAALEEKKKAAEERKTGFENLKDELEQSGELQISTVDPDARALPKKMNIVEVGYNVQLAADSKHSLISNYGVTNENDTYALHKTAKDAKEFMGKEKLNILADKGYHNASELKKCADDNLITYVAVKEHSNRRKDPEFRKNKFIYNKSKDAYICPDKKELGSNGNWYSKKGGGKYPRTFKFQRYQSSKEVCGKCPFREKCGPFSKGHGKYIERGEFESSVEANKKRVQKKKELYRKRQEIVEHPFGTIKRQWGFDHTLLKTIKKVDGEFALIFTCYNLRRSMSILGVKRLLRALKKAFTSFFLSTAIIMRQGEEKMISKKVYNLFSLFLSYKSIENENTKFIFRKR